MSLRIGYKASAEQFGPRELVELGVLAEQHGFDSVVVSDHYQPWRHEGGHAPFSLAWLGAVGERTERVMLGTSVLTPTFRYHPAVIAQAFATLGCLFPGRVMLGVGTGEAMNEVAVTGIEWPAFKERFARLRESVRLIRELCGPTSASPSRATTTTPTRPRSTTAPRRRCRSTSRRAARRWRATPVASATASSAPAARAWSSTRRSCCRPSPRASRRPSGEPDSIDRMIEIKLSYDPDPERALENTRFWAPLALTAEQKGGLEDPLEMASAPATRCRSSRSRAAGSSPPTPTTRSRRSSRTSTRGFTHLVFHAPGEDQERFLAAFEEQLMPRLRAL